MDKADLRRWVENRRVTARVEQAHLADTWGPPAQAIKAVLNLIALEGRLHGWPASPDPVTDREDHVMWERFARLRARFGPHDVIVQIGQNSTAVVRHVSA